MHVGVVEKQVQNPIPSQAFGASADGFVLREQWADQIKQPRVEEVRKHSVQATWMTMHLLQVGIVVVDHLRIAFQRVVDGRIALLDQFGCRSWILDRLFALHFVAQRAGDPA